MWGGHSCPPPLILTLRVQNSLPPRPLRRPEQARSKNQDMKQNQLQRRRTRVSAPHRLLVRLEVLPVGQVDHVLQHRRPWRQFCRIKERSVEVVVAVRRTVDQGAALEGTGGVLRVVQADQRAAITQCSSAPLFDVAEEVVHSTVSTKISPDTVASGRLREVHILSARDRQTIVSSRSRPTTKVRWVLHAGDVRP